ncbi:hypothetical protein CF319_g6486 [Tilletia indica]|nr:hypothetical protein CF319_g6486 [Tilletia indica]
MAVIGTQMLSSKRARSDASEDSVSVDDAPGELTPERFATFVERHNRLHFDGFMRPSDPIVRSFLTSWIPSLDNNGENVDYWMHHLGNTWPECDDVQVQTEKFDADLPYLAHTVKADIRVPCAMFGHAPRFLELPPWFASCALLSRIAVPNPALRVLHLRISIQTDIVRMVENILRRSDNITDVVIEADSPPALRGYIRPVLDLGSIYVKGQKRALFDRFIIRAPALAIRNLDCNGFFYQLSSTTKLVLAVHSLESRVRTWEWAFGLLQAAPALEAAEISLSSPRDAREDQMPQAISMSGTAQLRHLVHLTLNLFVVDTRILARLNAPKLKYLRIRSARTIQSRERCSPNHFPALFCANIWCPSPPVSRFQALGLLRGQFIDHLPSSTRANKTFDGELLAYIRPYALFSHDLQRNEDEPAHVPDTP